MVAYYSLMSFPSFLFSVHVDRSSHTFQRDGSRIDLGDLKVSKVTEKCY